MNLLNRPEITETQVKEALRFSCNQILKYLPEFTYQFQNAYSENNLRDTRAIPPNY